MLSLLISVDYSDYVKLYIIYVLQSNRLCKDAFKNRLFYAIYHPTSLHNKL